MRLILSIILCLFTLLYAHEEAGSLSVILDFSYLKRNISDNEYLNLEVPEYLHPPAEDKEHSHAVKKNGFNLNYGEVAFLIPVEENIEMSGTFHLAEDTFEIEELYGLFKYKNFLSKIGKFRSETGILNKQHDHDWYFYELPVTYLSFFSVHGLNEKGIQGKFQNKYLNTGLEILNGDNEKSFGYGNASLYTAYIKPKYKNFSTGLSFIQGKNKEGKTISIYIFETLLNLKKFIIQGEYLERHKNTFQSGFYILGVYKPLKNLHIGYRYEYLKGNLYKHSIVANFYKRKNIRLRFQYNIDKTRYSNKSKKDIDEFIIEITLNNSFKF